jgi:AcrR family transcriptional regulator
VTEHGLDVSHDEIAREAGVAVGTVYRRYPRTDQLFETVFVDRVDAVVALAEEALTADDAWEGFSSFLVGVFELQAHDRGLREFMTRGGGTGLAARAAASIQPVVGELVRSAHADGALRADIGVGDIPLIPMMVGAVMDAARHVETELWRRVLAVILNGISAGPPTRTPARQPAATGSAGGHPQRSPSPAPLIGHSGPAGTGGRFRRAPTGSAAPSVAGVLPGEVVR